MKKIFYAFRSCVLLLFLFADLSAQPGLPFKEEFENTNLQIHKIGRGVCKIENGVLRTKDAYAGFGDHHWTNYEITFSARIPETEKQVQIWAGFRAFNRDDRYIVGLKGGIQNDLYLSRQGYMGTDEFLGLRALDFHPETGKWYNFKIQVCGNRIRVFLNDEKLPRIDVVDRNSQLAPSGEVILGGSWIENEFDHLSVVPMSENLLKGLDKEEYAAVVTKEEKEKKRAQERAAYKPVLVSHLNSARTEISLDGQWLFMPEYELKGNGGSPTETDQNWHSMTVPNFWNPIRIWLHGETFGPHAKGVSDNYFQQETARCESYTFDYKKTGVAWYRHWIELPSDIKGKDLELDFDAVSKVAEVWINGKLAGSHVGMFGDFKIDGSKLFKPGKNLVAVKVVRDYVKDIQDASKIVDVAVSVEVTNKMLKDLAHGFYGGDPAGIWQPVKLVITDPVKITDVFIKSNLSGADFEITLKNNSKHKRDLSVSSGINEKGSGFSLFKNTLLENVSLNAGEEKTFTCSVKDLKPRLWSPEHPNLYDFSFRLISGKKEIDDTTICSGFRTFQSKDGYLWLNGHRYWLHGANHTPFALAPNDKELADTFYKIMKAGHIDVTRTHTTPYNELWMDAADRNGIGISFEGTWPWLMINSSMPDKKLIDLWADEFLSLLKKYRNHPSLLMWTVNNEMKFYDNEPDFEKAKLKMKIISDVVKKMRIIDPTRPICFDSNYKRNVRKFGEDFFKDIDDGDIDDIHTYPNWYNYSVFNHFKGEFQKNNLNPGRPLISQEMSTGYPNNETGHPTRFYTLVHQNPQSLVGNYAYEYNDPVYFLESQSFITGELAEALRRTNDKSSGMLHFALLTWFRNPFDPKHIEPYVAYYGIQRAFQPVLVSAELWGRHFYAGEKLPARICIVNDQENGSDLGVSNLTWQLVSMDGNVIGAGNESVPMVKHYAREWLSPEINIPANLPTGRTDAKLVLKLTQNGQVISENEYKILLAKKEWSQSSELANKRITLVDFNKAKACFDFLHVSTIDLPSVSKAVETKAAVYVFSGLDLNQNCTNEDVQKIRALVSKGAKVLLLNSDNVCKAVYPEYVRDWIVPTEGDIVNMEIPESPVFNGIEPMDLRYFNNNQREIPTVCHVAYRINRNPNVEPLATHVKVHGYINGEMAQRSGYMETIKGFPILKISDKGTLLISSMSLEKSVTDPVAGKLLSNLLELLSK